CDARASPARWPAGAHRTTPPLARAPVRSDREAARAPRVLARSSRRRRRWRPPCRTRRRHRLASPARGRTGRRADRRPRRPAIAGRGRGGRRHPVLNAVPHARRAISPMSTHERTPAQALARQQAGALLIDVRDAHERALGTAKDARGIARADLEANPATHLPDRDAEVLLICQSGRRSQFAAEALRARGYRNVASVVGGTVAWADAGLPMDAPQLDEDFSERYSRHLRLPEVGLAGQKRLEAANVLVVGAGGLGSPAAYYLAAAGVGTLRIADDDVVDRSNLQRQILHADARIG